VVPVQHYLIVSALLFSIGASGVVFHRNLVSMLLSVELMLSATTLTLVASSRWAGNLEGRALALLVIVVAAAEAVLGLGILVAVYRGRSSLDVGDQNILRH
jgi:NADH-quinone oxidoreductase subunit K